MFVKSDHTQTTRPSKKLAEKYLGPFEIIAQASTHSFTLHLPSSMRSIHPVFYISMLEPSTLNLFPAQEPIPEPLVILDGEPEYESLEILDSKINKHGKCKLQYLIRWMGYEGTEEETSWLPASELGHISEVISDLYLLESRCWEGNGEGGRVWTHSGAYRRTMVSEEASKTAYIATKTEIPNLLLDYYGQTTTNVQWDTPIF